MIATWTLVVYLLVNDTFSLSPALTSIPGFTSEQRCKDAGEKLSTIRKKELKTLCIEVK